jgi:hypothetical protein
MIEYPKPKFRTELVLITVSLATMWLVNNPNVRKLDMARARRMADDVVRGDWKLARAWVAPTPNEAIHAAGAACPTTSLILAEV